VIRDWIGTPDSGGASCDTSRPRPRAARGSTIGAKCWAGLPVGRHRHQRAAGDLRAPLGTHEQHLLVSTMGILSVAAAVHEAYAYKKADKELIKQYRFMQRIFGAARRRLTGCSDLAEKRQVLRTLGEAALADMPSGP
jgi:hypothetical protein